MHDTGLTLDANLRLDPVVRLPAKTREAIEQSLREPGEAPAGASPP